jgi:hypothetical protein
MTRATPAQAKSSNRSTSQSDDRSFERFYYALYIIVCSRGNTLKPTWLHQAPTDINQHISKEQSGHAANPSNEIPSGRLMQFSSKQHPSMQYHYPCNITIQATLQNG